MDFLIFVAIREEEQKSSDVTKEIKKLGEIIRRGATKAGEWEVMQFQIILIILTLQCYRQFWEVHPFFRGK